MILAFAFALLQVPQAATPPSSSAPAQAAASAAPVQPYPGSLAEGLAQMQAVCEAGDSVHALEIGAQLFEPSSFARWRDEKIAGAGFTARVLRAAEPVLDALDCNGLSAAERAAVHYALGVVQSREGKRQESADAFDRARELAGAGTLRLDAIYNLGVLALEQGEELRKSIPELNGGQQGAPTMPPPAAQPAPNSASGAASAPDPLEQAIQSYLHARTQLLERLKADWQDADTRANLELVQRRLKELDELKKKREEEKQKQENKDQQQKDQKDKDKQDSKDQKDQDKEKQDQDKSKDDSKDKSKDQKPDEKPPEDKQKPEEKPEDQPKPDEKPQDDKKESAGQDPSDPQEKLLTKEEMMRLFEMLKQTEEQGKRLEQQLRQVRRAKVKKDW